MAPERQEGGERDISSGKRKRRKEEGRAGTADQFHPAPSSGCQEAVPHSLLGVGIFLQILSITSDHQLVPDSFILLALGRGSKSKPDCSEPGRATK